MTGQGAREEAEHVTDKTGDDHFDDLLGKPGRRGCGCAIEVSGEASPEYILLIPASRLRDRTCMTNNSTAVVNV